MVGIVHIFIALFMCYICSLVYLFMVVLQINNCTCGRHVARDERSIMFDRDRKLE